MTEKILGVLFMFIHSVIAMTGYAGLTLLMAIESACIPLPSELIMPFAGYLVFQGTMKLFWVATAGAIGCNLGSLVAYEIGCYGGRPLVEKYGRWILMGRRELDWARPLLRAMGISCGSDREIASRRSHLHRIARRNFPHAPGAISSLYFSRFLALVFCASLVRHEAWRKLARVGKIFPPVRCHHRSRPGSGDHLVCVVALAEPYGRYPVAMRLRCGSLRFTPATTSSLLNQLNLQNIALPAFIGQKQGIFRARQ